MIVEHLLVVVVVVLFPIFGLWSWRRLARQLATGRKEARLAAYAETIVVEWGLAVVVLLAGLSAGRSIEAMRLGASWSGPFVATSAAALALAALLLAQARAVGSLEGDSLVALRRQVEPLADLLPHTAGERAVFAAVSLTAGFCEELLYRGFLTAYLQPMVGTAAAVVLAAVAFGLVHAYQGGLGILRTAGVGLVLGAFAAAAGAIWPAVALHVAIDLHGGALGHAALGRRPDLRCLP